MGNLLEYLRQDVRFEESLKACMNCGMCTAVCPAAEFYDYDPRRICDTVQRGYENEIERLLRKDTIWYCGQCMSCKTRCPRGNVPGELINVLRKASQELGYYKDSEKGRQQTQLMNTIGSNILEIGYCVHPDRVDPDYHPEQGPVWEWYREHIEDVAPKLGANYHGQGAGALRNIPEEDLNEVRRIFEVTGGMELRKQVTSDE
ncbi:MAG: 4Fe-4S dicluster domain-containing protein [Bacteroidales bacterium]|nr:4Fe-4S dicluster domain-containing protein [Bacteroidales bacterium]